MIDEDDPLTWRPQRPLEPRVPVTVHDPIVEPLWSGDRVIVHFNGSTRIAPSQRLHIIDSIGDEVTVTEPAVARELLAAVAAQDAVLDGVMTTQATRGGEGTALVTESNANMLTLFMSRDPGVSVQRKDKEADPVVAFVAIDLLRVDGQSLLDLPLLERKRLLESVIVPSERVRVSVHTRPPVEVWVASWQAAGLRGAMLKAANSRYEPGSKTPEWRKITKITGR